MSEHQDQPTSEIVERQGPRVMVPSASVPCSQVWTALAAAQGEIELPKKDTPAKINGVTAAGREYEYTYHYASLAAIVEALREPFAKNGLFRQQYMVSRGDQWFVRTVIAHSSGEWVSGDYPVIPDRKGEKGFAAAVTFARRYGLSLLSGVIADELDEGHSETAKPPPPRLAPVRRQPPTPRQDTPVQPDTRANGSTHPTQTISDHPEREKAIMAYNRITRDLDDAEKQHRIDLVDRAIFHYDEAGQITEDFSDDMLLVQRVSQHTFETLLNGAKAIKNELRASA